MLELVVDAVAIFFRLAIEQIADGVEGGEIGKLVEADPGALRFCHAVIADHDEIDGQPGGGESGVEFADEGVHAEGGGAGLARVGSELVTGVVGLGEVDGDEVRTVGGGEM